MVGIRSSRAPPPPPRPRAMRRAARDSRLRRRCRRIDIAVAHFAENAEMRHIDEIIVELHHMLEAGTGRRERVLEIDENLLGLGAEIARRTNDPVVEVKAELARNVDDPPGAHGLDHVRVAGWL